MTSSLWYSLAFFSLGHLCLKVRWHLPILPAAFSHSTPPKLLYSLTWSFEIVKKGQNWWGLMDGMQICDLWRSVSSFLVFTWAKEWRKNFPFPSLLWVCPIPYLLFLQKKKKSMLWLPMMFLNSASIHFEIRRTSSQIPAINLSFCYW